MKRVYRTLGAKRLRLRYRESDRLDALKYVKKKLEEAGYAFDKLEVSLPDLPMHDMLHFSHPHMGHIQIPARYVPKELQSKQGIGKAISASLTQTESAYKKLRRRKRIKYEAIREEVSSTNESVRRIGSLILIRALKGHGVEVK